ncbi:MAG: hypothetical protein ACT452_01915 [Microthrixaceae bacterium]
MRRRLIPAAVALAAILASGLLLASRGEDDATPAEDPGVGLETRTLSAGEIDIRIEPRQIDDQGAAFAITLDTHSAELSMDLGAAKLEVAGTSWPVRGWDGDGPSGHHREGELRFEAAGPASGTARLALPEFPEPVEITWELGG